VRVKSAFALVGAFLACLGALAATPSSAARPVTAVTVSFDDMGTWTGFHDMDRLFFKSDGVIFASDYVVGFSNGHAVLDASFNTPPFTIAGSFSRRVKSVSASIRVGEQGTSDFTIVAYSQSGRVVGSGRITLTQNGLDGKFYDVTADGLSSNAKSFSIVGRIG